MALAQSKITTQGQISIPAELRRKMGVGPGSVLEWDEEGDKVFVRRVGRYTFEDVHRQLFPDGSPSYKTDEQLKQGVAQHMRKKFGRH